MVGWIVVVLVQVQEATGLVATVSELADRKGQDGSVSGDIRALLLDQDLHLQLRIPLEQASGCLARDELDAAGSHLARAASVASAHLAKASGRAVWSLIGAGGVLLLMCVALLIGRLRRPQPKPRPQQPETKQKTEPHSAAEKLVRGMENHTPAFLCNQEGRIEWANDAMAELLGGYVTADQLIGMTLATISNTLEFDRRELSKGLENSQSLDTVVKIWLGDEQEVSVWHMSPSTLDGGDELFFTVTISVGYNYVASREVAMISKALASYSEGVAFVEEGRVVWANDGLAAFISHDLKGADLRGRSVKELARILGADLTGALEQVGSHHSVTFGIRKGYQDAIKVQLSPVKHGQSYVMTFRKEDELTTEVLDLLALIKEKLTAISSATEQLGDYLPVRFLTEVQRVREYVQADLFILCSQIEEGEKINNLAGRLRECLEALENLGPGPKPQEIEAAYESLKVVTGIASDHLREMNRIIGNSFEESIHPQSDEESSTTSH
jgi:PAS domain-containing protein